MDIVELDNKSLWVSTFEGIFVLDLQTKKLLKKFNNSNGLPTNTLTKCAFDKNGVLWIGTQNDGIITINSKTNKIARFTQNSNIKNALPSNSIKTLTFDNDGLLWIGTADAGICSFNAKTNLFTSYPNITPNDNNLTTNLISHIFIDSNNELWICQNGCLNKYNKKSKALVRYSAQKYNDRFIQSDNVCFITEDKENNYWIGTYGSGIYCLNKEQNYFHVFSSIPDNKNSLKGNIINGFADLGTEILLGIDYNGLQYFNPSTNTFRDFENPKLSQTHIWGMTQNNDDVWCSTWGEGIYRINTKTKAISHFVHYTDDPKSISINNIKTTATIDNQIWIGTWSNGIEAFDKNFRDIKHEELTHNSKTYSNPSWVNKIMKDSKGRIWISTMFGVYVRKGTQFNGYFNDIKNNKTLQDDIVYSSFEDSKHQIWLLTNKGLDKFIEKSETFEHFGTEKNLPKNPMAMLEDNKQTLWISAIDGLYSLNNTSGIVRKYTYRNGLPTGGFICNSALKTTDGTLFFGGKNGFVYYNPEILKPLFDVPKIVLRHLYLDNVIQNSLEVTDTALLKYSNSVVTIDVADLQDIVSNFASFEYSFDGKKTWKTVDETRKIIFSNKVPGTYFLHIKASYDNKKYSNKLLTIIVIPPWWMTWWFRMLCLSIVSLLLYSYYKIRMRVIQKQNELLTRLVEEKTRDLVDANEELQLQNTDIAEKELLLQIRNDELQKTNVTKDKIFAIISQDLKTHFSGIMENAFNLNKSKLQKNDTDRLTYIDKIYGYSKKINSIIDMFSQWSKSQTKTLSYNPIEIDVETLIRENISLFYNNAKAKQIEIEFTLKHQFNAFADGDMISIVLRNLMSNAIKFTPLQGCIHIQTSNIANYTVIQVKDNGIGMNQEEINDIYTKSVINSRLGTAQEQGTGLGLVICRDFLNFNKAKIEISSQVGEGTSVSIFLPKGQEIKQHDNSIEDISDNSTNIVIQNIDDELVSKLRLLIVEDNLEILRYIVDIFESYYIIETARNGEEGFKIALESVPDLVISDINMPIKTGLEMCLEMQSEPILQHIPVIILSAHSNFDMQAKGLKAGAFDFVVKPFDRTILFLKVQSVLESRKKFKEYLKKQFIQQPSLVISDTPEDKFLMMMHKIVEINYVDAEFSVEKFSTEMGYSRSQFFRKVKAIIDISPIEYLNVFRLNKAKEMIETGKWTISNVAYDVGFNDPHYFSLCFKNHFGFPPSYYLKNKN